MFQKKVVVVLQAILFEVKLEINDASGGVQATIEPSRLSVPKPTRRCLIEKGQRSLFKYVQPSVHCLLLSSLFHHFSASTPPASRPRRQAAVL